MVDYVVEERDDITGISILDNSSEHHIPVVGKGYTNPGVKFLLNGGGGNVPKNVLSQLTEAGLYDGGSITPIGYGLIEAIENSGNIRLSQFLNEGREMPSRDDISGGISKKSVLYAVHDMQLKGESPTSWSIYVHLKGRKPRNRELYPINRYLNELMTDSLLVKSPDVMANRVPVYNTTQKSDFYFRSMVENTKSWVGTVSSSSSTSNLLGQEPGNVDEKTAYANTLRLGFNECDVLVALGDLEATQSPVIYTAKIATRLAGRKSKAEEIDQVNRHLDSLISHGYVETSPVKVKDGTFTKYSTTSRGIEYLEDLGILPNYDGYIEGETFSF